jgi:predicted nuclease of restriction endonuclease-like RecB superfamily
LLTVDQAGVTRRGNRLSLKPLPEAVRGWATELAQGYLSVVRSGPGRPRHEIEEGLSAFDVSPRERKLAEGLRKLLLDACEFEMEAEPQQPAALRRAAFLEASAQRKLQGRIDRSAVLSKVGAKVGLSEQQVDELLFADLREAHRLVSVPTLSAKGLVERYERARAQAVLLRATRAELWLEAAHPSVLRALFGRLKFLRLLHRIQAEKDGFRVLVDGPLSLFGSVTKYGLSMGMLLSVLDSCGRFRLRAEVLWGKDRLPCLFELQGSGEAGAPGPVQLSDELQRFVTRFCGEPRGYEVHPCHEILEAPGQGVCVPDLVFVQHGTGRKVYFEVMGYWSRQAVFRKVDLVAQGLAHEVIFAVSQRLRVSEEVLPAELPAALYVYKGVMSPGRVKELLDRLCSREEGAS